MGGAGGLVHHQPVCLGPEAQTVVLRLRLLPGFWFGHALSGADGSTRAKKY